MMNLVENCKEGLVARMPEVNVKRDIAPLKGKQREKELVEIEQLAGEYPPNQPNATEPRRLDKGSAQSSDHYARCLRETSGAVFMYASMAGLFQQADTLAFLKFRHRLMVDAGSPTDPIEIMLIEQLALGHFNIGRLHFKSATAEGLEAAKVYGSLAVSLTGEFRRSALALSSYRAANKTPNSAACDDAAPSINETRKVVQDDVHGDPTSKNGVADDGAGANPFRTEPGARGGGETEHPEAERADYGRSSPAARLRTG